MRAMKSGFSSDDRNGDPSERKIGRRIDRPKAFSLGLFSLATVAASFVLPDFIWFFVLLFVFDSVSTYFDVDFVLIFDRLAYGLVLIVLTATVKSYTGAQLILESLLIIVLLDFSFLLRKIGESQYSRRIIELRLRSYAYTLLPAYFVSVLLLQAYFYASVTVPEAILVFGLSSAGVLAVVYFLVRYSIRVSLGPKEKMRDSSA